MNKLVKTLIALFSLSFFLVSCGDEPKNDKEGKEDTPVTPEKPSKTIFSISNIDIETIKEEEGAEAQKSSITFNYNDANEISSIVLNTYSKVEYYINKSGKNITLTHTLLTDESKLDYLILEGSLDENNLIDRISVRNPMDLSTDPKHYFYKYNDKDNLIEVLEGNTQIIKNTWVNDNLISILHPIFDREANIILKYPENNVYENNTNVDIISFIFNGLAIDGVNKYPSYGAYILSSLGYCGNLSKNLFVEIYDEERRDNLFYTFEYELNQNNSISSITLKEFRKNKLVSKSVYKISYK